MVHAGRALTTSKTAVSSDGSLFDRRLLLRLFYFAVCWLLRWCFNRLVVLFICWLWAIGSGTFTSRTLSSTMLSTRSLMSHSHMRSLARWWRTSSSCQLLSLDLFCQLGHFRSLKKGTSNALCDSKTKGYLSNGYASDFEDCKQKCSENFECKVFSYWTETSPYGHWCQTNPECTRWNSDRDNEITTYERYKPESTKLRK